MDDKKHPSHQHLTIQAVMFQRLSNLLFGEVEEVAAELKGPNPCVTEADEEGWMLVNLPGESQQGGYSGGLNRSRMNVVF